MTRKQLLTHSRMDSFRRCRRKHYYEYELGLRKAVDAKALRMGTAGHEGLDALKRGAELQDALDTVRKLYATAPEGPDQWEWEIELETVECLVTGYQWRWANTNIRCVASELGFEYPLVNPETNASSLIWNLAG